MRSSDLPPPGFNSDQQFFSLLYLDTLAIKMLKSYFLNLSQIGNNHCSNFLFRRTSDKNGIKILSKVVVNDH